MTYITLFSLVPTLAVAFSIFKALGGLARTTDVLMPKLLGYIAVGVRGDVAGRIDQFINNIHGGALGSVGTLVLLFSVLSLLTNMEDAFNEVWGVEQHRTLFQRASTYWMLVTVAPTLLVIGVALPSMFRRMPMFEWVLKLTGTGKLFFSGFLPLLFVCVAFSLTYWTIPNTRVRPRAAASGGVIAGSAWLAAFYGYAWYTTVAVTYSRIYGSLAAIPFFLFWIYLTWLIVLFGAEIAFAVQSVATYQAELQALEASQAAREVLALRIVCEVARRFVLALEPATPEDLAHELHASARLVNELSDKLARPGLVRKAEGRNELVPGADPHTLSPADVLRSLRELGERGIWVEKDSLTRDLDSRRTAAEEAARRAWGGSTIAELALGESRSAVDGAASPPGRREE